MSLFKTALTVATLGVVAAISGCAAPEAESDAVASGELKTSKTDLEQCEQRYKDAAGPFTRDRLHEDYELFPASDYQKSILSYDGVRARYEGHLFQNAQGALKTTVQEVMASSNRDALNAAMVYEFLTTADNDGDYPEVWLMALELQRQFPNVEVNWALYYIVSGNPNLEGGRIDLAFCHGDLWTYRQIKEWMASYAIPKLVKANPDLVREQPFCAERDENGKILVCGE